MKRITKLLTIILCLAFALCSFGCKGSEKPYKDSAYLGEWKANSIESRNDNKIVYVTATLNLEADGSCNYRGKAGKWEPLEDKSAIKITLGEGEESFNLTISKDGDKLILKYRIDTFYRAEDFIQKDTEIVSPPESESARPGEPEPPELF